MPVTGETTHAGGALTFPAYRDMGAVKVSPSVVGQFEHRIGDVVSAATQIVNKRTYYNLPYQPDK